MIGIVLAAGAGRRLRPDTDQLPKALLPVDGATTILDICLHNLAQVDIVEVAVVIGYAAGAVRERAGDLQQRHGVRLHLVPNDQAEEWNNAYSLWLAREHFARGALLLNGDTVHPVSVEQALLRERSRAAADRPGVLLAVDQVKQLADEEMKVRFDQGGQLRHIHKSLDPDTAHGEYIGAALIDPSAGAGLARALAETWQQDPARYYEDGIQRYADQGGRVRGTPIGLVDWVEVDNHADLARARQIRARSGAAVSTGDTGSR